MRSLQISAERRMLQMSAQKRNARIAVSKALDKLQQAMIALPNKETEIKEDISKIWDKLYAKYK